MRRRKELVLVLLVCDGLALMAAFALAYLLRFENPWLPYFSQYSVEFYSRLVFWVIPAWLVVFALYRLYDLSLLFGGTVEYRQVVNACTVGLIVVVLYSFSDRDANFEVSRGWLLMAWILTTLCVALARFGVRRLVYALRRRGHLLVPVIVVGASEEGRSIAHQLSGWSTSGLYLAGIVDDHLPAGESIDGVPVLGDSKSIPRLIAQQGIREIVVAPSGITRGRLLELFRYVGTVPSVEMWLAPGLFELLTTGIAVKEISGLPLVSVNRSRITGMDAVLKTTLDHALAAPALVLLLPVFAVIAIAIKLDSPGPVIHRRRVLGSGGRPFDALKFRTMVRDADERLAGLLAADPVLRAEYEETYKLRNDPRITRVGGFLRRTSLDELPQLVNVLLGQMSLVGPRMIVPEEADRYGQWRENLLTVKPGMTGPWQADGRSETAYEDRVRLSMNYIRNYSIWLDVQIIFQTIGPVLRGRGAY